MQLEEELKSIENQFKVKQQEADRLNKSLLKVQEELVELNGAYKYIKQLIDKQTKETPE